MGVDPFAALGIDQAPPVSMMTPPGGGDAIPMMKITPEKKGGVNPFSALGIESPEQHPAVAETPPPASGLAANFAAGANKSIAGALGAPVDLATWGMNLPGRAINAVAGTNIPQIEHPVGGSEWLQKEWGRLTGINPADVQPANEAERMAQGAGGAVAQVPMMALGGLGAARLGGGGIADALAASGGQTTGQAAQIAAATGAGGAAGQLAEDKSPEWAKPYANLAGNLAGAGGALVGMEGARAGYNAATSAAGRLGIGPKTEVAPGVRATESQAIAAGQKASDILGPEGRDQLTQFGQIEGQARALEAKVADPATAPAERMMAQKQLQALQPQREQLVPGAQPTVAQLVPNEKTVAYERDMRTLSNPQFATRDTANNQAMAGAVQAMAPGTTGPEAVSALLRRHLDQIDQLGQATTTAARQGVEGATQALGGVVSPGQAGGEIRQALMERNAAAKARESALWQAIDPEGKLALPLGSVQETARGLLKEMNPNLGDAASGPEMQILNGASGLPSVVPFQDAQRLRSNIGSAERALRATPGNDQSLRRLGILKSSLDDAIGQAADGAAAADPELAQRVANLAQQDGHGLQVGGRNRPGDASGSAGAASGVPGESRGLREIEAGSGNAQGDSAVAIAPPATGSASGVKSNFDAEAAARYAGAREATLARKQTYGQGAIGRTLQPGQQGADFRVETASVPRQFLTGNAVEPARVQQYIAAVGGAPEAVAAMRDALVGDLRQKGIVQPDGLIKPPAFDRWLQQRGRTIDLFPGLREQLGTARQAQQLLDDATAAHVGAVKAFQNGVASDFLKADPKVAVGRIFSSGNSAQTARQLYDMVKDSPDALAGLRRGMVDHLDSKFNVDPNGAEPIKSKAYRDFMDQHRNAFKIVFNGQGAQNIDLVEAMLNRIAKTKQTEATLGSNTAQKAIGAAGHGATMGEGARTTLFAILGEHLASNAASLMGHEGLVGMAASGAGVAGGVYLSMLRRAGIRTMNDLGREMMLNPELTRALMQKVPTEGALGPVVQRRVATALRTAALTNATERKAQ